MSITSILAPDEPPPFEVVRPEGRSRTFLLCDHASPRLPRALGDLGVSEAERFTHIGWDIGAAEVARELSRRLDAPLVLSGYSRLAIDCNRPPGVASSIPEVTCGIPVPGNVALDPEDRSAREEALFWPYHRAAAGLFAARDAAGVRSVVLSIHSFTPSLHGKDRPWHVGVLYGRDRRVADRLLAALAGMGDLVVGDNQPYWISDNTDYGIPVYGERAGRPSVMIEIRQDLIGTREGAAHWGERLAGVWASLEAALP
jgi:predicted N-formylglutamate amidohydrolase